MGYLTVTNLVDLKIMSDKQAIETARLRDLIQTDLASDEKHAMSEGTSYYDVDHDILDRVLHYWIDGQQVEDKLRANNKLPHPFHKILVDQKVSYIVGNPIVVSVEAEEEEPAESQGQIEEGEEEPETKPKKETEEDKYLAEVLKLLGYLFDDRVNDWVQGASNKGVEWMHFYVDPEGSLRFTIVPAEQVIPIYDTQYQDRLVGVVRFYVYTIVNEKGESQKRYKVEWWTASEVTYWEETLQHDFMLDQAYETNPAPHWFEFNTSDAGVKTKVAWGRVPFIPLYNNDRRKSDLVPIKALVDAYDKVVSGWVNDLDEFQELIYVLKGYSAVSGELTRGYSELGVFMQNLKTHKVVTVESDGGVDTVKAEIPVEAREKFLAITRKAIFYFGEGIDVDNEKFNTPSGIALKFLYSNLDLKANRMIRKLKIALADVGWFVTEFLNKRDGTSFDPETLTFTVNKSMIFNEQEKIQSLQASETMLSKRTILENHPYVDDVEQELSRLEEEQKKDDERNAVNLEGITPVELDENGKPVMKKEEEPGQ